MEDLTEKEIELRKQVKAIQEQLQRQKPESLGAWKRQIKDKELSKLIKMKDKLMKEINRLVTGHTGRPRKSI